MSLSTQRLSVRHASKTFGTQQVLRDVELDIEPGEIHALVGHNGSGKSTLVKLLAGYHQPDPGGEAEVDGLPFNMGSAQSAETAGLRFVHQDLGLVETLDAVDNLFLGAAFPTRAGGRIDWAEARRTTDSVLGSLGFTFDSSLPVRGLSATQKTGIAIARAIRPGTIESRVVVLDEPTAALPAREVGSLFEVIRALQRQGLGILYISHHLEEVFALAGRVTVLRDGTRVATTATNELDEARLVELMLGEELATRSHAVRAPVAGRPITLGVRDLCTATLDGVALDVRAGEIVGVAGVDGSGREELAMALFGGIQRTGDVTLDGAPLPVLRPDVAVQRGVGFVPADRANDAVLPRMTVAQNLTVGGIATRLRGRALDHRAERAEAEEWTKRLAIRPPRPDAEIGTLSGGNQQKVILARWLRLAPKVLLLDEPTKGVDVAAVSTIWDLVDEAARNGTAVVACSSDTDELVAHCDRVVVLRHGRVAADVGRDDLEASLIDALALTDSTGEPSWK